MEVDEHDQYLVKPMNCPFHVLIYRSQARSYRDLPQRLSELGSVYRYERSGVVQGLLRVRGMTQDDSHTFCTVDQVPAELRMLLEFVMTLMSDFGFDDLEAELSTRPEEKWVGELGLWELAETSLAEALDAAGVPYRISEGEGAFYGPKIDIHLRDAMGRRWQMSTIQLDFALPERFGLEYTTAEDTRERPVMIHCAKFGTLERFIAVLVEHHAGAFPMWLSPTQAVVIPVADRHQTYATRVADTLADLGLRVESDLGTGKLGEKVRKAITHKVGAVLVVGDDDVDHDTVGLRFRGEESERRGVPLEAAGAELKEAAIPPR